MSGGGVLLFKSLRCSYCNVCWPLEDQRYDPCPLCREPTEGSITAPIPTEDAELAHREHSFGWWLWDHDRI